MFRCHDAESLRTNKYDGILVTHKLTDQRTGTPASCPCCRIGARFVFIALAICFTWGQVAYAGGGPENTLVVVNSRSWASLTIANHYVKLRKIPPNNVVYINWDGSLDQISVETFREKILKKIVDEMKSKKILSQIDYIIYSSDFPYSVDLSGDLSKKRKFAVGSLTGLTYLLPAVLAKRGEVMGFRMNWYYRTVRGETLTPPTHGFRSIYPFNPQGQILKKDEGTRQHYFLSTMLGYTSGRGNSVREVLQYLKRSAQADGTQPRGTIYLVKNSNVRSTTRHRAFPDVVAALKKEGVSASILDGTVPKGKKDVLGAVIGSASYPWGNTGSQILPGAICESLTSYSGILREGAGQTPLTELLRYGAAGSSGTVVEPYAIQAKFPHPMIQVHYAKGCSLAEAFYQSVHGPYQLLIVGDPLCQPWAKIPTVSVEGIQPNETVKGTITIRPNTKTVASRKIARFQLFVDGLLRSEIAPGKKLSLDTTHLADGYHELRIVAVDASPIETQGRLILPIHVNNHGRKIEVRITPKKRVRWGETVRIAIRSPGSKSLQVYFGNRPIGRITGEQGAVRFDPKELGLGPMTFRVVGIDKSDAGHHVVSEPITIEVIPSAILPAIATLDKKALADGLMLIPTKSVKSKKTVTSTKKTGWLAKAGVRPKESFRLIGYVHVPKTDVYQFQAHFVGQLNIKVDRHSVLAKQNKTAQQYYAPVPLAAGWHRVEIQGRSTNGRLRLAFGGQGTQALDGKRFKHRK